MDTVHGRVAVCPLYHRAVELIGRRWTGAILRSLHDGETRFSDITESIPGLSDRLLSERLKELEAEGIVTRTVFPEIPVRIEYRLTDKGRALGEVMDAIGSWAHRWLATTEALAESDPEGCWTGDGVGAVAAGDAALTTRS
jgi:DNA-binding HxlR family transcriptional regulator